MRTFLRIPVLLIVALLAACQEAGGPMEPAETGAVVQAPVFSATRTEWQNDITFGLFSWFEPCVNDGQGEDVEVFYRFLFDWSEVVTPSGSVNTVGTVTYHPDMYMEGLSTGDLFTPTPATRQNRIVIDDVDGDGVFVAHNNTHEVWMNQDGDRVHFFHTFQIVRSPSGELSLFKDEWRCVLSTVGPVPL